LDRAGARPAFAALVSESLDTFNLA
jgi:hypothetical protein